MHKHLQHVPMSDIGSKVGPSHFFSTDFSTTTKEVATITKEVATITYVVANIIKEVATITKLFWVKVFKAGANPVLRIS